MPAIAQESRLAQSESLNFILGGNALFTLKSLKTGTRFTYKVLADKFRHGFYNVYVLVGPDNTRNYKRIGEFNITEPNLRHVSVHTKDSPAFIAFDHVYMNLCIGLEMPMLEIWHVGRCCRCGRLLTVPESISRGIGPECMLK